MCSCVRLRLLYLLRVTDRIALQVAQSVATSYGAKGYTADIRITGGVYYRLQ